MRNILIATGIFPPDIGGPALYSQKLAEEFSGSGKKVSVMTYGSRPEKSGKFEVFGTSRFWPFGIRQLIYFIKLLARAKSADLIIAFDSLGAGLPAVIAGKLFGKKVIIRMGGDFLWERHIGSGAGKETITEFYQKNLQQNQPFLLRLIGLTLRNADKIAFTTDFQKDLFIPAYGLDPEKSAVIGNIFEKILAASAHSTGSPKTILWAGRFIKLKNLEFLIGVFKKLLANDRSLILKLVGDGPEKSLISAVVKKSGLEENVRIIGAMSEELLAEEIKGAYFCILPSLGDISPNFVLNCLALGKPIVLTQETGIRNDFSGLMYADPKNENSFYQSALRLMDENSYDNYLKHISDIRYKKTWKDLAAEYLKLAEK